MSFFTDIPKYSKMLLGLLMAVYIVHYVLMLGIYQVTKEPHQHGPCYPSCTTIRSLLSFHFLILISLFSMASSIYFITKKQPTITKKILLLPVLVISAFLFFISGQYISISSIDPSISASISERFSVFTIRSVNIEKKEVIIEPCNYVDQPLVRNYIIGSDKQFTVIRGLGLMFNLPDCSKNY